MEIALAIIIPGVIIAVLLYLRSRKKKATTAAPPPVVTAPISDWRPMLGPATPGPIKRTPKHRIQYQANGFDELRPRQIDKTVAWLTEEGANHLIGPFIAAANEVADIPTWIDGAYDKCAAQYRACGGKYAAFIATDDPSAIVVEIVATPMRHPTLPHWAGGLAFYDKKTIRIVIMTTAGMKDNPATLTVESPATAHLALFKDYIPWEIGNMLMIRYGFVPKVIPDDEWGDKGPQC